MTIAETEIVEIVVSTDSKQPDSINNCICF